ncbi:DUF711 domain-containing protein [Candidatus Poribacteria bacterium]|nr:MAG: DUF711 domain-containing protein [Candidatus Poribacteria bacterium]
MKIRTVTVGIPDAFSQEQLQFAVDLNRRCQSRFESHGYEVQTTRVNSQAWDAISSVDQVLELDHRVVELGGEFFSLGTIFPRHPQTPAHLSLVSDIISQSRTLFTSATVTTPDQQIGWEAAEKTAAAITQIAHKTDGGLGNLRFAAIMNCPPNTPFFPAAYWQDEGFNLGIGWQAADLVYDAFVDAPNLTIASERLKMSMEQEGKQIAALTEEIAKEAGIRFVGLDVSPAPMGVESIASAIEAQLSGRFGERGTLTVVAAITWVLDSLDLPRCGYSGLMLPVLEDEVLGNRSDEGCFNLDSLLLYSAVCGTGLDTIPIPGDASISQICGILTDVASLSIRWGKPLSARLFPVPGLSAGELTRFDSPYLTNTTVMAL